MACHPQPGITGDFRTFQNGHEPGKIWAVGPTQQPQMLQSLPQPSPNSGGPPNQFRMQGNVAIQAGANSGPEQYFSEHANPYGNLTQSQSLNGLTSMPQTPPQGSAQQLNVPDTAPAQFFSTSDYTDISQPPPKFDIGHLEPNVQNGPQAVEDPFGPVLNEEQLSGHGNSTDLVKAPVSTKLNELLTRQHGPPSCATALSEQFFPFIENAKQAKPLNYGVVKLRNIPFGTKRSEVIAFMGRNVKILNDTEEPIHIIMERVTSKTMDAYVEFSNLDDAMKAVERHHLLHQSGRVSRLGERTIEVELSSQASLMKDLFPLAKGIFWNGAKPEFLPPTENEPWNNFKGFISEEEMTMLIKHVEVPYRSPFSKECPQRPYECLISTLKKFPWSHTAHITIAQRQAMFKATCELLRLLPRSIQREDDVVNLNIQLHRRVVKAAMSCPGFTPLMKADIGFVASLSEPAQIAFGQPLSAPSWRHQYAIAPKRDMPADLVEWYISTIREQSCRDLLAQPMQDRNRLQEMAQDTDGHWGFFWTELGYTHRVGRDFDTMTLAEAARCEFHAIERILSRALPAN